MAPYIPELRKKLSYPLYGADFDPLNPDFLLVGGGGGSTSSGVPNKISLIDSSRRTELNEIADIELDKNEDSVTTLAVASSTDTALTAIAGINSSVAEQEAGKNEHLRSFRIPLPRKRKVDGSAVDASEKPRVNGTQALGKTALFRSANGPKNDTYQRVLRASPIQAANEARLAVIASGLAPENEIVAFQPVANALTSAIDEISRISLGKHEAADVDVKGIIGYGHMLAYCTDSEVFLQRLPNGKGSSIEPAKRIYQCPESTDTNMPSSRLPKFRAIRILTPKHVLVLQNRPHRAGAGVLILAINKDDSQGYVSLYKRLPSSTKSGVGLDICPLTQSEGGQKQYIIAIAGQDSSIEILTIDYIALAGFAKFKQYTHLKGVHSGPLTKITFSNFVGPTLPVSKDTPPQSVRLASVGVDQTVVVHTLRLRPHPTTKTDKPSYVLVPPGSSEITQTTFSVLIAILVASISAFLLQAFCEIRGAVPPTLGAPNWLSEPLRQQFYVPYVNPFNETKETEMKEAVASHISAIVDAPSHIPVPTIQTITESLFSLLADNIDLETPLAIVMRAAPDTSDSSDTSDTAKGVEGVIAEIHDKVENVAHETLSKWDDLSDKQKKGWRQKLVEAGHWVEGQGEGVLRGVLFGELAAFAGG